MTLYQKYIYIYIYIYTRQLSLLLLYYSLNLVLNVRFRMKSVLWAMQSVIPRAHSTFNQIEESAHSTYLAELAYTAFLSAVRFNVPFLPDSSDYTSFDLLLFSLQEGRGATPLENSLTSYEECTGGLLCLAFASAGAAGSASTFGNAQWRNFNGAISTWCMIYNNFYLVKYDSFL
jgi:hypothetical protein